MFFITTHIPSWFFGAMLPDPTERERGLLMTIRELAAIPLWTLGIAGAITGALALVLCGSPKTHGSPKTESVRHDWDRTEAEALYALPFADLMFRAQVIHRRNFD